MIFSVVLGRHLKDPQDKKATERLLGTVNMRIGAKRFSQGRLVGTWNIRFLQGTSFLSNKSMDSQHNIQSYVLCLTQLPTLTHLGEVKGSFFHLDVVVLLAHQHYNQKALPCLVKLPPKRVSQCKPLGIVTIQLAHHRGAKVLTTALNIEDKQYLEQLRPTIARVINMSDGKVDLVESCLEETGGLGVDIILDIGEKRRLWDAGLRGRVCKINLYVKQKMTRKVYDPDPGVIFSLL
ncbi:QORL1 protein, partial [Polypterus senegalus]